MDSSIYTSDESSDDGKASSFDWNNTSVNGEDLQRLEGKKRRLSSLVNRLSKRKRISTRGPSNSGRAGGSNGAEEENSRPSSSASARASAAASRNRKSDNENIEVGPEDRIRRDRVMSGTRNRHSLTRIAGHRTRGSGDGSSMASSASRSLKRKKFQKDSAALSDSESELESDTFDMNRTDIDGKALEKAQAGKKPEFKVPLISRGRRSTNAREVIPVDDSSSDDEGSSKSFDMNNSYINPEDLMKAQSQPDRIVRPLRQLRKLRSPVSISERRKGLSPIPATGSAESADSENVHGDSDKSDTEKGGGSSRVVMSETVQPQTSHVAVVSSSAINQDETDIIFSSDGIDTDNENEERTNVAENLQNVTRRTGTAGSTENVEARRNASIPNGTLNDPTVTLADVVVSENDQSFHSSVEGTFTNSTATRPRIEDVNGGNSSDDVTRTMSSGNCSNDDDIEDVPPVQLSRSIGAVSAQQHHQTATHRISTPFPHSDIPFIKPLPQPTATIPKGNASRISSKSIFLQSSRSLESSKTVFGDNIDKEEELIDLNKVDADKTRTAPSPSATRPASFSGNYIASNSIPDPDASVRRKLFKSVGEVSDSSMTGNPAEKRASVGRKPALVTPTPQTQWLVSPRRSPRKIVHPTKSNSDQAGDVGKQPVPTARPTSKKSSQTYGNETRKSGPQVFSSSSVEENDVQEDANTASAPSTSSGMSKHFKHHLRSSKGSQNMGLDDEIAIEGNRSNRRLLISQEKRSSVESSPKCDSSNSHRSSVVVSRMQIEEIVSPRRSPRNISHYKSISNPVSTGGKKSEVTGSPTVKPSTRTCINETRPSQEGSQDRLFSSSSVEENDSHEQQALTSVPSVHSRRSKRLEHQSNSTTEEPQIELFVEETVTEDNQSKRRSQASHEILPSVVSQLKSRSSTLDRNPAVDPMSSNTQTEEALLPRRSPRKTRIPSKSIADPATIVEKQPRKIGMPTDEKSDERRSTASGSQAKLVSFSGEHEDKNEQQTSTSVPSTPLRRSTRFENQSSHHMSDSPGRFLEKQAIGGDQSKQKSPAYKSSMGSGHERRKLIGSRQEISISSGGTSDSEDQSIHPGNRNISSSVSNREGSVIRESSRPLQTSRTSELNLSNAHSGQSDVPGSPSRRAADLSVSGKHGPKKDMPTFLDLLRAALDKQKNNPPDGPCLSSERINVCPLASHPATAKWTTVKSANVQPVVRVNKATTDALVQAHALDSRSRSKDVVSIQKRASHTSASVKRTLPRNTSRKSQTKVGKRRHLSITSSSSEEEQTRVRRQGRASYQQRQFNVNTRKEQQKDSDEEMSHDGVEENPSSAVVEDHSDVYRRHSKKASTEKEDLESADDSDQEGASIDGADSDGGSENRLTDEEDNENETNDKPGGGTVSGEEESLEGNAEVVSVDGSEADVDSADNRVLDEEESEPEPNDEPERVAVVTEVDEEEQEDYVEENVEIFSGDESGDGDDGTENRLRDEEESEPELNDQPERVAVGTEEYEDEEEQEDFVEENVEVVSVDESGDSDDGTENGVSDEEESEPELNDQPGSGVVGVDEDEEEQVDFVAENAEVVSVDESGDSDEGPESGVRDDEESEPELNDQPERVAVGTEEDEDEEEQEDFVEENVEVVSVDESGDSDDGTENGVSDEEESEPELNDQPGSGLVSTVDEEHEEYTEENVEVASVDRSDVDADTTQTHGNDKEDSEPETNGYGSDIEEVQQEEIEENVDIERVSGHLHDENDLSEAEDEEIGTRSLLNKKTKGISRRSSIAKSALSDASDSEKGAERNTSDRLSSRSGERDQIASQSRKSSSSETSVKKVAVKPGKRKVTSTNRDKSSSQSSSRSQSPRSRRGVNEKTQKHISVSLPKGKVAGSSRKQRGEHHVVLDGENGRNAKYVSRATLRHMLHTRMETFPIKGLADLLHRINGELQNLFNKLEAQSPNGIFTARELEQELMNLDLIPKQRGILFFMLEQYTERSAFSKLRKNFLP